MIRLKNLFYTVLLKAIAFMASYFTTTFNNYVCLICLIKLKFKFLFITWVVTLMLGLLIINASARAEGIKEYSFDIAEKDLNRIVLPFADANISTISNAEIRNEGQILYVLPKDAQAITLFVESTSDPLLAMKLTLYPKAITATSRQIHADLKETSSQNSSTIKTATLAESKNSHTNINHRFKSTDSKVKNNLYCDAIDVPTKIRNILYHVWEHLTKSEDAYFFEEPIYLGVDEHKAIIFKKHPSLFKLTKVSEEGNFALDTNKIDSLNRSDVLEDTDVNLMKIDNNLDLGKVSSITKKAQSSILKVVPIDAIPKFKIKDKLLENFFKVPNFAPNTSVLQQLIPNNKRNPLLILEPMLDFPQSDANAFVGVSLFKNKEIDSILAESFEFLGSIKQDNITVTLVYVINPTSVKARLKLKRHALALSMLNQQYVAPFSGRLVLLITLN